MQNDFDQPSNYFQFPSLGDLATFASGLAMFAAACATGMASHSLHKLSQVGLRASVELLNQADDLLDVEKSGEGEPV